MPLPQPREEIVMELSESNMREYFDRIVTQFQFLTTAGKQVEELQAQVNALDDRVNDLDSQNEELRRLLHEANQRVEGLRVESQGHEQRAHDVSEHVKVLQDTIVYSDGRVKDLTDANRLACEARDNAKQELQAVTNNNQDLQILVSDLRSSLEAKEKESEAWKTDAQTANNQIADLRQTLEKVQSILSPTPHSFLQAVG